MSLLIIIIIIHFKLVSVLFICIIFSVLTKILYLVGLRTGPIKYIVVVEIDMVLIKLQLAKS